jgi:hypothetical protein
MPRKSKSLAIVPVERVQDRILVIRGQRVILAADLARLYGVTPKRLNEAVRRNADRFPNDFMFQLTWEEAQILRSQFATLRLDESGERSRPQSATVKGVHGRHSKYRPFAFTEHGTIMAATILNSEKAVQASLFVVRAFVKLRELLSTHHQLAEKLAELERKLQDHDGQILAIVEAIKELMEEPEEPKKPPIGFQTELAGSRQALTRRKVR